MNVLKDVAKYLKKRTGLTTEVEPSRADIMNSQGVLVVSAKSFWRAPYFDTHDSGILPSTEHSFQQYGLRVEGCVQILPIRVTYRARGNGEMWVSTILNNSFNLASSLCNMHNIPFVGDSVDGKAYERMKAVIPDFDEYNIVDPVSSLSFVLLLDRATDKDKAFTLDRKDDKSFGYLAEQVFEGDLVLYTGMEVPK